MKTSGTKFCQNDLKMTQNVDNFCFVQVFSIVFWFADRDTAINESRRTLRYCARL